MSTWWLLKMFAWVPAFLGGDILTRQIHHWAMWFFILFTIVHVYLVFYHDYVEGWGEIRSMGGGSKFIEEEVFEENKPQTPKTQLLKLFHIGKQNKTLILGVGNYLMGDEGVGVHVANRFQHELLPVKIDVFNGGT